ncbi:MAG: amidohydrolase family protein [Sphingobacterium sp.]
MRIDSHQHFWLYEPIKDAWIGAGMEAIQKNFLPNDISGWMKQFDMDGVVAVQADQSTHETDFLLELGSVYALIKGVVGWVDLRSDRLGDDLSRWSSNSLLKGFRHLVEQEQDPDFLIRDEFLRGLQTLQPFGYTFDLLVGSIHYSATLKCVAANPGINFVLDHMAKPQMQDNAFALWANFIAELSKSENVYCKISGLVTQGDWNNWSAEDFVRHVSHVVDCFGSERIMFGSDWPVCLLAAQYKDVLQVAEQTLGDLSQENLAGFWGKNATNFYGLK